MPLEYTLRYAAPEVVQAACAGVTHAPASAAADMYAIGLIAWELLTSETVFAPNMDERDVEQKLCGEQPLPWEEAATADRLTPRLRVLQRSVLQCLSRDPEERPTSRELLGAWNGMFESLTGTTRSNFEAQQEGRHDIV